MLSSSTDPTDGIGTQWLRRNREEFVARWLKGVRTVEFLVDRGRLETFESSDLAGLATAHELTCAEVG